MSHDHNHNSERNLRLAFFLNVSFTIFEIIGGLMVNSVAILSDAIHDLGDSLSLGLAWFLDRKSKQQADHRYSFGYARFSLLGALINSLILVVGAIFVTQEAIERLIHPEFTDPQGMILFAIVGVIVNAYAAWKLRGGKSLNEQVLSWHLIEDVLGWVAILIGAIVLYFKYIWWLDPALSIAIMLYISFGVIKRLRQTLHLFLQGVPKDLNIEKMETEIMRIEGIHSMHDTHLWSLDGENHVFSSHLRLAPETGYERAKQVKSEVKQILKSYGFDHYTIETEHYNEECDFE